MKISRQSRATSRLGVLAYFCVLMHWMSLVIISERLSLGTIILLLRHMIKVFKESGLGDKMEQKVKV